MAKQDIGLGAAPNDGTGDSLRVAGEKINENFTEVYDAMVPAGGTTGQALVKLSNDDHDMDWGDVASGGIGSARGVAMTKASSGAVADAAYHTVSWDTTVTNADGMWSAGAPTKFIAPSAGWYVIGFSGTVPARAGAFRGIVSINRNGVEIAASGFFSDPGFAEVPQEVTAARYLNAGDEITCHMRSDTVGGAAVTFNGMRGWMVKAAGGGAENPGLATSLALAPLPAFQNGWQEYGGAYDTLRILKTGRLVTVNGILKTGASGTVAFNLPAGWRPLAFIDIAAGGGTVTLGPDGNVTLTRSGAFIFFAFDFIVPEADAWNGGARPSEGVAFPAGPVAGLRFYRTDRKIEYVYDGTRWLSTQLFSLKLSDVLNSNVSVTTYAPIPFAGVYSIYLERLDAVTYRDDTGGTGEWDYVLIWRDVANAETTLATIDGAGDTGFVWTPKSVAIGAILPGTARVIVARPTEISGSAAIYAVGELHYRLVG